MAQATGYGVTLEYDTLGPRTGAPLLIIQGLGDQMVKWSDGFPQALVDQGFHVIRFDNRDVGLSTHLHQLPVPEPTSLLNAMAQGLAPTTPYQLEDMAADAVAVLDGAGVERAHIVGASMGGMIAQLVAARYPSRVLSLTSIMSGTGNPATPPARPEAIAAVMRPAPHPSDEAAFLEHAIAAAKAVGSPGYSTDEKVLGANLLAAAKRDYDPAGLGRQIAAIIVAGDRREQLRRITVPTLVIHGADDPLAPVEGGRDTAANITGAELLVIPGMAHDLPHALFAPVASAIASLAARAKDPGHA